MKQHARKLVAIIALLGLLTFPALAAESSSNQLAQQPLVSASYPVLAATADTNGNPNVKVWVNTNSGVYHCPGARWYGNTKSGTYMTQKEAQQKGNRPAYGKFCQ
jgi:hypothetical protein